MAKEWQPWEESEQWKSKSAFFTWLRGQLRKAVWQHYPPRNEMKKESLRPATEQDYESGINRRTKKVGDCHFCKQTFPGSKLQVDHIISAGSLRNEDDIKTFIMNLACMKDEMRLTCEPCHKIHTYAEKHNLTFEQSRIEKKVIEFSKKPVKEQQELLTKYDLPHNNQNVRKQGFRTILSRGEEI